MRHKEKEYSQAEKEDVTFGIEEQEQELDRNFVKETNDSMDTMMIFAGLFSAAITQFISSTSLGLKADPSDLTNQLLRASLLIQKNPDTPIPNIPDSDGFEPPNLIIAINAMLFFSLILSLLSALGAMVVKQWIRRYETYGVEQSLRYERLRKRAKRKVVMVEWHLKCTENDTARFTISPRLEMPRTPKSPGFLIPVKELLTSCDRLMITLRALVLKCDSPKVEHPSARKVLTDLQSHVLDACVLVQRSSPGRNFFESKVDPALVSTTSEAGKMMIELSNTYDRAEKQLDLFRISTEFADHIEAALNLKRLFNEEANGIIDDLLDDHASLQLTLREISFSTKNFLIVWNRVRDEARNVSEANQTYASILHQHWIKDDFQMEPSFPSESMDILSIPSVDDEMQRLGREWVNNLLDQGDQSEHLSKRDQKEEEPLRLLSRAHTIIKEKSSTIPLTNLEEDLKKFDLPTEIASKWPDIIQQFVADEGKRKEYLRIFVFGKVNHGKTSIINSLIGRILLHSDELPATAWPLVVRHRPKQNTPQLYIDPEHFDPYLKFMQKQRFSARWQAATTVPDRRAAPTFRKPRGLGSIEIPIQMSKIVTLAQLKKFETPGYKFPEKPPTIQEVYSVLADINTLMRCCFTLKSDKTPFPDLKNMNWPRLEVEFDAWGREEVYLELLDLPGLDEQDTKMPQYVFEHAVANGVDGCLLAVVRSEHSEKGFIDMVKLYSLRTRDPPLAVFATHSETGGESARIRSKFTTLTWKTPEAEPRVVFCAPGLYASTISTFEASFSENGAKLHPDMMPELPNPDGHLKDFDQFWGSLSCYMAVNAIFLEKFVDMRPKYEKFTRQGWKTSLDDLLTKCKQTEALKHFEEYILQDGDDRRQLYALTDVRSDLRRLMSTQSDMISMLLNVHHDCDENSNSDLLDEASERLKMWRGTATSQDSGMKAMLETELEEVLTEAKVIVNLAVEKQIPKGKVNITTAELALEMIKTMGDEIKPVLDQLDARFVAQIRAIAAKAWHVRIKSLLHMLLEVRLELPSELMRALEASAVDPSQAIREETTKSLVELTRNLKEAEGYWKNTMAKPWLPHQAAQAKAATGDVSRLPIAEKIVVSSLNQLGFLYRPPVSGDAFAPPLLSDGFWPSTYPSEFEPSVVKSTLTAALVNPWFEELKKDTQLSVIGTMQVATSIATGHLEAIIESRRMWHANTQKIKAGLMDSQLLDKLVLQQARCCLLYGAVDTICKQWILSMAPVLPQAYQQEVEEIKLDQYLKQEEEEKQKQQEEDNDDEEELTFASAGI